MDIKQVILVNETDHPIGEMEKIRAHELAVLHRAFSIFIFNHTGEMLLQQRAEGKYHSGGLWTNACCSHPGPGEETEQAALRRLKEELGFETELEKVFDFVYKQELDNGLTEHEFDHVFAGIYSGEVLFDVREVMSVCYKPLKEIERSLLSDPGIYTAWFTLAFPRVREWFENKIAGSK